MTATIGGYLEDLERQLRVRRTPRLRLLREVEDHLRDVADELAASGLDRAAAEARAVARFGAAVDVAARFAEAAAATSAHRAAKVAAGALVAYAATFVAFATSASPLVRDFPQGAPSFFGIQLAAVALAAALVRSLRGRPEAAATRVDLSYLTRPVVVAGGALTASALAETAFALARPAGIVAWSEARWLTLAFATAAVVVLVAAVAAVRSAAQTSAVTALPGAAASDELPLLRHPWRLTLLAAAFSFALVTAAQLATAGTAHAVGSALLGLVEATAIVGGFALFGGYLGLRDHTPDRVGA